MNYYKERYTIIKFLNKDMGHYIKRDVKEIFPFMNYFSNVDKNIYGGYAYSTVNSYENIFSHYDSLAIAIQTFLAEYLSVNKDESGLMQDIVDFINTSQVVNTLEIVSVNEVIYTNKMLHSRDDLNDNVLKLMEDENCNVVISEDDVETFKNVDDIDSFLDKAVVGKIDKTILALKEEITELANKRYLNDSIIYKLKEMALNPQSRLYQHLSTTIIYYKDINFPPSKIIEAHEKIYKQSNEPIAFLNESDSHEYKDAVLPLRVCLENNEQHCKYKSMLDDMNVDSNVVEIGSGYFKQKHIYMYPNRSQRFFINLDKHDFKTETFEFFTPAYVEFLLTQGHA